MSLPPDSIAVILPAYNEEVTVAGVIRAFHAALPQAAIYVIDNNSKDATARLAADTLASLGCKGRVIPELRQGKGNAVRRAFHEVNADVYLMVDADLTYPANRAMDLIQPVIDGRADMVVGDRLSGGHYARENKRPLHGFGNGLVVTMINKFFGSQLRDTMSGYRAFSRTFVKNYAVLVEGFQLEIDVTLHALDKRFRILELPVEYVDRPAGSASKLNTLTDGARVIFAILQILRYYKPLAFFTAVALASMLLGLVAAIPVFNDWIQYRYIYHVPLAILAAALEIVGALMLSVGLMLDSIAHQRRTDYELRLLAQS
ncbi:glycosyltransferase [Caenimonas koreensis]|uniref:glycosyltransferase n=1 Tax=Caenimonas koreensis TaxID=367474 RepID=UPI0037841367